MDLDLYIGKLQVFAVSSAPVAQAPIAMGAWARNKDDERISSKEACLLRTSTPQSQLAAKPLF